MATIAEVRKEARRVWGDGCTGVDTVQFEDGQAEWECDASGLHNARLEHVIMNGSTEDESQQRVLDVLRALPDCEVE